MDVGLSSNNTRHYVNISQLMEGLKHSVLTDLPGAFTGTDLTASFMNKGQVKALELLMKMDTHAKLFDTLGEDTCEINDVMDGVERFVCSLYEMPKLVKVNDARFAIFQQRYAPRKRDEPLDKIKGVNQSYMPPCRDVLTNKVRRAHLLAALSKKSKYCLTISASTKISWVDTG